MGWVLLYSRDDPPPRTTRRIVTRSSRECNNPRYDILCVGTKAATTQGLRCPCVLRSGPARLPPTTRLPMCPVQVGPRAMYSHLAASRRPCGPSNPPDHHRRRSRASIAPRRVVCRQCRDRGAVTLKETLWPLDNGSTVIRRGQPSSRRS